AMLVDTELTMAGYKGDRVTEMQRRMIDALSAIPGVESVGLSDQVPLGDGPIGSIVFTDQTTDLRPANAAAESYMFKVSPDYFRGEGTVLLSGRAFTWHDDKNAPTVAVINQEFARRVLGSVNNAIGKYFKMRDGTRTQIVGIVEDGKYGSLTEKPTPAMFLHM